MSLTHVALRASHETYEGTHTGRKITFFIGTKEWVYLKWGSLLLNLEKVLCSNQNNTWIKSLCISFLSTTSCFVACDTCENHCNDFILLDIPQKQLWTKSKYLLSYSQWNKQRVLWIDLSKDKEQRATGRVFRQFLENTMNPIIFGKNLTVQLVGNN